MNFFTWKVGKLSSPGKSSISPVAMLKHAPCHGHRTCPFDSTPNREELFLIHSYIERTICFAI